MSHWLRDLSGLRKARSIERIIDLWDLALSNWVVENSYIYWARQRFVGPCCVPLSGWEKVHLLSASTICRTLLCPIEWVRIATSIERVNDLSDLAVSHWVVENSYIYWARQQFVRPCCVPLSGWEKLHLLSASTICQTLLCPIEWMRMVTSIERVMDLWIFLCPIELLRIATSTRRLDLSDLDVSHWVVQNIATSTKCVMDLSDLAVSHWVVENSYIYWARQRFGGPCCVPLSGWE